MDENDQKFSKSTVENDLILGGHLNSDTYNKHIKEPTLKSKPSSTIHLDRLSLAVDKSGGTGGSPKSTVKRSVTQQGGFSGQLKRSLSPNFAALSVKTSASPKTTLNNRQGSLQSLQVPEPTNPIKRATSSVGAVTIHDSSFFDQEVSYSIDSPTKPRELKVE